MLKSFLSTLFFFIFCSQIIGQNQYLDIQCKNNAGKKLIDSIGFIKKHLNTKLLFDEVFYTTVKLQKMGYISATMTQQEKLNDSTYIFNVDLKNQIQYIDMAIGDESDVLLTGFAELKAGISRIKFIEIESYLLKLTNRLENKGYSQAKVQLLNITQKDNHLTADLDVRLGIKRQINDIVIVGYDKFPKGIKNNIIRPFKNKNFSTENLQKIKNAFNDLTFISQSKDPEILFLKDTTKVYVYLQKVKANRFDGLIGFGNGENNTVRFNGYLDLFLLNTINAGEKFNLNWKSDGNNQTNFNIGIEIPSVFKSRLILKSQLQIFKQDSLFQNTKFIADLGYLLRQNLRLFVGIQSTESTNIQASNATIKNFDTQFTTIQFDYLRLMDRERSYFSLFQEQTRVNFKMGIGNRKTIDENENQNFAALETMHNIHISEKISVNIRSQSSVLISKTFFTNELYRFGGINSIRGFNENSLQANAYFSGLSELRYAVSPDLYVHTVADFGWYKDNTTNANANLLGLGAGFGLLTKNGLLQFIYANGQQNAQGNSIVHISFKIGF